MAERVSTPPSAPEIKSEHATARDDPALQESHQHHHEHLHHSARAEAGRHDDPAYTTGTTFESTQILSHSPLDHDPNGHHHDDKNGLSTEKVGMTVDDAEKGGNSIPSDAGVADSQTHRFARFYRRYKIFFHVFFLALFTGWWIASLVLHHSDKNWIIPFLVWLCITIRIVTFYVPITVVSKPMHLVWNYTGVKIYQAIPEKFRTLAGAAVTIAAMIVGSFASEESADNTRANRAVSLFGLGVIIAFLWITSANRKAINWHPVIAGMLCQFIIALFVLRTEVGYDIFSFISNRASDLLGFAGEGTAFLTDESVPELGWFLTGVIPPIIFFVSLVQVFYYIGVLQWFVVKTATFFFWALRVSGAEAVVAAATPFIGQGESAMLVRPFVPHMTIAEIHQIMCCGFATISGSVLVAYISLGLNAQAMVSSCIMSIPASLAISKLRYPETEETLTAGRVVIPDDDEHRAANALHAFANGAWLGIKIAGMIIASLLCIIALIALINALLTWWGRYLNINDPELTLELLLGYIFYPVAFLLGVPRNGDLYKVAQLIGIKVIANEYVAFSDLTTLDTYADLSARSRLIATYALCGFGNIGSLGIQIGILAQLAPGRAGDVSRVAMSALFSGVLATLTSASVAGLVVTDQITALGG
ncbi:putative h+ nucleoside cotransporter [Phaeomoniella chlamydospora]|uniref:Putative h+ nucleoside cotransporter n=1 Tax=Phaeomoniella chlamydospora TaxID=158046 RepID=A0A0G2H1X7_PHACM|nr:putative h+ nucleoside cotransporter [Phaeomoniella chlamydospora]